MTRIWERQREPVGPQGERDRCQSFDCVRGQYLESPFANNTSAGRLEIIELKKVVETDLACCRPDLKLPARLVLADFLSLSGRSQVHTPESQGVCIDQGRPDEVHVNVRYQRSNDQQIQNHISHEFGPLIPIAGGKSETRWVTDGLLQEPRISKRVLNQ